VFRLVIRFFIICIVITLLIAPLILYVQNRVDAANNLGDAKLIAQGELALLDEYLKPYPPQTWQSIIDRTSPQSVGIITVLPIDKLPLTQNEIKQLKQGQIVYSEGANMPAGMDMPFAYKQISNTPYAYQETLNFSVNERVRRWFGLSQTIISTMLRSTPQQQWPALFKKLTAVYGYPVSIHEIKDLPLNNLQKQQLLNKQWLVDLPKKGSDALQVLYAPIPNRTQALKFAITLPFIDTYKTHILFTAAFIALELITFIFAIFFARSLDKLKLLAGEYGQGDFDSRLSLKKTSTLFPLFNNLRTMGNRIKRLLTSHKELINSVSHELRTPISRLRFSLELLKTAKNNEEIARRTATMEEDISELEDLVSEVLTYAQLDRLEPAFELKTLQIISLVELAVKKFKQINSNKKLLIDLPDDSSGNISIQANEKYVLRALQNLLQNAERHAKLTIKISLIKDSVADYQLSIEDDGPGIPTEDRERIFEPFAQLANQTDTTTPGYGLGLAITKKIIDWHHWKISVGDSDLGGAKILIYF
jgi:two-component system sensor histidine kinase RstB